jgi:hypothetical protein
MQVVFAQIQWCAFAVVGLWCLWSCSRGHDSWDKPFCWQECVCHNVGNIAQVVGWAWFVELKWVAVVVLMQARLWPIVAQVAELLTLCSCAVEILASQLETR